MTNTWIKVSLSSAAIARGDEHRLNAQFEAVFMTALAPVDAAMFADSDTAGGQYHFYFSPGASRIFAMVLSKWSPEECQAPARDSVALLIGHAGARDMLK